MKSSLDSNQHIADLMKMDKATLPPDGGERLPRSEKRSCPTGGFDEIEGVEAGGVALPPAIPAFSDVNMCSAERGVGF